FFFHLPFFPSGALPPENEEIRSMRVTVIGSGFGFVSQDEGGRLIPILPQILFVIFHQVDGRQLIDEPFILNGVPHLAAGETTAHVAAPALHAPRGIRGSDLSDHLLGLLAEAKPLAPIPQLLVIKHPQTPRAGITTRNLTRPLARQTSEIEMSV